MQKIFVFSNEESPRLNYVLDWLFKEHYPADFSLVHDFNSVPSGSLLINYSEFESPKEFNSIQIVPSGLLFEKSLNPEMNKLNGFERFKTEGASSFDIFSAIFFMLTRYEEYVVEARDKFGRFTFRHATTFGDFSWLSPVCDIWAAELVALLNKNFNVNLTYKNTYSFVPTFDIDIAFAYRFKGFSRTVGSLVKKFFKADYVDFFRHLSFLTAGKEDPYDTYDLIHQTLVDRKFLYFIHLGNYGKLDNSLDWNNEKLVASFLTKLKGNFEVGIHPSFLSNSVPEKLEEECRSFKKIFNCNPAISRQHYLALSLPETYRRLLQVGIQEDYSLGFAETIGFRAGTCSPFFWYDLMAEKKTDLLLFPQTYMDRSLTNYMKLNAEDAAKATKQHIALIKQYNGTFTPIWHNSTINENQTQRELFQLMFEHGI